MQFDRNMPVIVLVVMALLAPRLICQAASTSETSEQARATILELKRQNSPTARAKLCEMAISSGTPKNLAVWAASAYCSTIMNKTDAARLLKSADEKIQDLALARMVGATLDEGTWRQLWPFLASGTARQMGLVASIAGEDCGSVPAKEKAEILLEEFRRLESARQVHRSVVLGQSQMRHAEGEVAYWDLSRCLMKMGQLDLETLATLTPEAPGHLRDCVLVARGSRGDANVKGELHRIVLQSSYALIRSLAIQAIGQLGAADGIPILERVAQEDPAVITNYFPHWVRSPDDLKPRTHYPLREKAAQVASRMRVEDQQR